MCFWATCRASSGRFWEKFRPAILRSEIPRSPPGPPKPPLGPPKPPPGTRPPYGLTPLLLDADRGLEKIEKNNENTYLCTPYSKHRNNRGRVIIFDIGGVTGGGFGGPGGGFGGPGGGFSDSRSSGKPLLVLKLKNQPQDHQNHHQDRQNYHQGLALLTTSPLMLEADTTSTTTTTAGPGRTA